MSYDTARLELARQLIRELGVRPEQLHTAPAMPTMAAYIPKVIAAATAGQLATYATYWKRAATAFAARPLDDIRPSDILALQRHTTRNARQRRHDRAGRYAGESYLRAMRAIYRLAMADGLIGLPDNPTIMIPLPRRLPSTRRALSGTELTAIHQVVLTGGHDVPLDSLLLRLHSETACRRGGALGLRLADLDATTCAVHLREKAGTERWQPITPTLACALAVHAQDRGATHPNDALLRHTDHSPLTARRYDALWSRVHGALPWADALGVTAHWLRHTTLTWVERQFGYGIARGYAGHTDTEGASTTTYIKAFLPEVATALSVLTGEPHPSALSPSVRASMRSRLD
ncbi:tyrosine-type recombinase/integrase [Kutzneria sp. CA-103260]|uniref:tyrosine-type recombinase/integrase n=1 Tax=Kutzneria sp. CA-103260 TaxID=2802641 RepID=UPI001BA4EEAD|nr:site-specific integrase [Kutzneria sp. CA-103260]QUQ64619.1 Phage integrase family protein [Kutzneria sp. CA-103260]